MPRGGGSSRSGGGGFRGGGFGNYNTNINIFELINLN